MTPEMYQKLCVRTCIPRKEVTLNSDMRDLLHGAMGLCTEAGELQDQLKRALFYGKSLDEVNVKEELGDALWYIGMMCERLGFSMEAIMIRNIEKLKVRFPEKFTEENALVRNIDAERSVLES